MRRAYLKRWGQSAIKTGQRIDQSKYRSYFERIEYDEQKQAAWFGIKTHYGSQARVEVLAKIKEVIKDNDPNRMVMLVDRKNRKTGLCYSSDKQRWWFVERHAFLFKRSIVYKTRERAMEVHNSGRIHWLTVCSLPDTAD